MRNMKKGYLWLVFFFGIFIVGLSPNTSYAKQPESSYWYPEQLLNWTPENDPDAVFNRSQIPLGKRDVLYKVNDHAQSEAKLVALSALNPTTSGVPSQGGEEFLAKYLQLLAIR